MEDIKVTRAIAINETNPFIEMDNGNIRVLSIGDTFALKEKNYYKIFHILPNNTIQELNIHLTLENHEK